MEFVVCPNRLVHLVSGADCHTVTGAPVISRVDLQGSFAHCKHCDELFSPPVVAISSHSATPAMLRTTLDSSSISVLDHIQCNPVYMQDKCGVCIAYSVPCYCRRRARDNFLFFRIHFHFLGLNR